MVKVIVGGAPLSDSYAKEIGADGYAPDANRAVRLAQSLLGMPGYKYQMD
jgi:5-methyltetrahydrofolate--homocysteine methyltransferase